MLKNLIILPDGSEIFSGDANKNAISSCTFTQCVNAAEELAIGSACCSSLELTIFAHGRISIAAKDEIQYFKTSDDGTRTKIGVFRCEKPTVPSTGTYQVVAYDNIVKLDIDVSQWLASLNEWPYTVETFAQMVCAECGLTLSVAPTINADFLVPKFAVEEVTGRKLMQWLGQITCSFVRANANGEIEFAWYEKNDIPIKAITTAEGDLRLFGGGLTFEDYTTAKIEQVVLIRSDGERAEYPTATDDVNAYVIQDNLLAVGNLEAVAQGIYERLKDVVYTPCTASLQSTLAVNAGDIVDITDRDGNTITAYIMVKTSAGQGDALECVGSYARDSSTEMNNLSLSAVNGKLVTIRKTVDSLRTEVTDEVKGLDSKIEQTAEHIMSEVAATYATTENLDSYVDEVTGELSSLQNQIDGAIETWFYDYLPTASNFPASEWTTTEAKNKHLGDLFYIVDNAEEGGLVYRWALTNGVYGWVLVEDTEVAKALKAASQAQDTADGKRRVFVTQPKPPYDVGDLWTDGTNLYVCKSARADGSFAAGDFELATDYTTEETVKTIIEQTPKGVEIASYGKDGTLVTFIGNRETSTGDEGVWEAEYTSDGEVTSSLNFDFSRGKFVFRGDIESSKMTAPEIEGGNIIGATLGSDQGRVKSKMDKTGLQLFYVDEDGTPVPVGIYGNLANEGGGLGLPMLWLGDKSDPDRLGLLLKLYDNGIWLGTDQQRDATGNFAPKENQDAGIFINNATGLVEIIRGLYSANTFEAVFS